MWQDGGQEASAKVIAHGLREIFNQAINGMKVDVSEWANLVKPKELLIQCDSLQSLEATFTKLDLKFSDD
jgi:uncharacterized protein YdeI (YjbR/CyaY-like superfamily)